jgi:hypothetical protein
LVHNEGKLVGIVRGEQLCERGIQLDAVCLSTAEDDRVAIPDDQPPAVVDSNGEQIAVSVLQFDRDLIEIDVNVTDFPVRRRAVLPREARLLIWLSLVTFSMSR